MFYDQISAVANQGNMKISSRTANMMMANGVAPRNICPRVTALSGPSVDLITNTAIPNGGVNRPISTASTLSTPSHTRSTPLLVRTGRTIGSVNNMIDAESRIVPNTIIAKSNNNTVPLGPMLASATAVPSQDGMPDTANMRE